MAQHARPNVSGHTLACRAQLIACSIVVVMTFSSKRPSIHGWAPLLWGNGRWGTVISAIVLPSFRVSVVDRRQAVSD
jgi:hypothetical protein